MIQLTRKERDRQLRRSDILRAAEHQFARKGYERATMQDIARDAQYGTGTVYLYFKDKESIYSSLIEEKISALLALLRTKIAASDDVMRKLGIFLDETLGYFELNEDFFRIFTSEWSRLHWVLESSARSTTHMAQLDHFPVIVDIVKEGQRRKVLRDDYNARQMTEILISVMSSVIFTWLQGERGEKSLRDKSGFILELFLNGARKR